MICTRVFSRNTRGQTSTIRNPVDSEGHVTQVGEVTDAHKILAENPEAMIYLPLWETTYMGG